MNVLPIEKQTAIIGALVEGNSIRSVERMTGVHRDTIMRLGRRVGSACERQVSDLEEVREHQGSVALRVVEDLQPSPACPLPARWLGLGSHVLRESADFGMRSSRHHLACLVLAGVLREVLVDPDRYACANAPLGVDVESVGRSEEAHENPEQRRRGNDPFVGRKPRHLIPQPDEEAGA